MPLLEGKEDWVVVSLMVVLATKLLASFWNRNILLLVQLLALLDISLAAVLPGPGLVEHGVVDLLLL